MLFIFFNNGILYADFSSQEKETINDLSNRVNKPFMSVSGISSMDKTFHPTNNNKYVLGVSYNSLRSSINTAYTGFTRSEDCSNFGNAQITFGSIISERFAYLLRFGLDLGYLGVDLRYKYNDCFILHSGINRRAEINYLNLRQDYGDDFKGGKDAKLDFYSDDYKIGFYNFIVKPEFLKKVGIYWGVDIDINRFGARSYEYIDTGILSGYYDVRGTKKMNRTFLRLILGINWGILNYTYNRALGYSCHNIGLNFYYGKKRDYTIAK